MLKLIIFNLKKKIRSASICKYETENAKRCQRNNTPTLMFVLFDDKTKTVL